MSAYRESARVYDALCRAKDYRAASRRLLALIRRVVPDARDLLDVGCGTGRHLEHLRARLRVEGLDASQQMLAVARRRLPGVPLHSGTLVRFDLGRRFDVVTCLFGSIGYSKTPLSLQRAVTCMARHVRPGGLLIVEPWIFPERFVAGRLVFDRVDDPDLKVARMYVTTRRGAVSVFDSHYVVATAAGVAHFTERQALGLFTDRQYRTAFEHAGMTVLATTPDLFGYGLYVCQRDVLRARKSVEPES
jgi:SAM-dependent methyltransferase